VTGPPIRRPFAGAINKSANPQISNPSGVCAFARYIRGHLPLTAIVGIGRIVTSFHAIPGDPGSGLWLRGADDRSRLSADLGPTVEDVHGGADEGSLGCVRAVTRRQSPRSSCPCRRAQGSKRFTGRSCLFPHLSTTRRAPSSCAGTTNAFIALRSHETLMWTLRPSGRVSVCGRSE
jgi:hypothetical protein